MPKLGPIAVVLIVFPQIAQAQPVIDAGTQIQQIPPPPAPQQAIPEIRVERPTLQPDDGPAGVGIRVVSLQVTGHTIFSEPALVAASGFKSGGEYNLRQLREVAARITAYYNVRGYFLAQAYLPAQDIRGGAVTIAVIEGRYGKIGLNNRTNLRDGVARNVLGGIDSGNIVASLRSNADYCCCRTFRA